MNWKRYTAMIAVAASVIILGCSGCTHPGQSFDKSGIAMDTTVSLRASGPEAQEAVTEGFQRINELDALASAQNPQSDVSRINKAAGREYVQVDPAIYEMISFSQQYSEKTDGVWDITVGVITNLWDIGNDDQHIPSQEEIDGGLKKVNYKDVLLRPENHSVMLAKEGMSIDLGGIAKGFAVDEIRKIYEKHHIQSGLINMGASSMYAVGKTGKGKPWNIGIKHPRSDKDGDYLGIVSIENQALSTSGDYERYFIQDGIRYHHIFNPHTGYPADSGVMSDSIVIDGSVEHGGMLSDMMTTVIFVLGPQQGMALIEQMPDVECEITGTDGTIYMTDSFQNHFSDMNSDFHTMK
jgi:thiamine biosynthesis lipoprotein